MPDTFFSWKKNCRLFIPSSKTNFATITKCLSLGTVYNKFPSGKISFYLPINQTKSVLGLESVIHSNYSKLPFSTWSESQTPSVWFTLSKIGFCTQCFGFEWCAQQTGKVLYWPGIGNVNICLYLSGKMMSTLIMLYSHFIANINLRWFWSTIVNGKK
jgi:hypothetical protein